METTGGRAEASPFIRLHHFFFFLLSYKATSNSVARERSRDSPDDLHGGVVLLVVHAHHEHGGVGAGGGDDDPLGASLQVSLEMDDIFCFIHLMPFIDHYSEMCAVVLLLIDLVFVPGRTEAFSMVVKTPVDSTT